MPKSIYLSKAGTVKILAVGEQKNGFVKKAIEALEVPYKESRLYADDHLSYIGNYQLKMADIEKECPNIYHECTLISILSKYVRKFSAKRWLKISIPDVDFGLNTEKNLSK